MEQLERTKRYLKRIEEIYEGVFSSNSVQLEHYADDVASFFIHCHHVKDWIIHLNKVGVTSKGVNSYINKHSALRVCADLANGSKHCRLTQNTRTENNPHLCGSEKRSSNWLTGSGGGEHTKCKFTIKNGEELLDALQLAKECVALWDGYIESIAKHNK